MKNRYLTSSKLSNALIYETGLKDGKAEAYVCLIEAVKSYHKGCKGEDCDVAKVRDEIMAIIRSNFNAL